MSSDFHRLWGAYSISAIGSALSSGALPLIAVTSLHVSAWQVSALAALSGIASAVIALPFGGWIEYRHKRPVMIGADLIRCAATFSVPAVAFTGHLSYPLLCVVAVINSAASIAFLGASGAHLKALVPGPGLSAANSRFETTSWLASATGSSAGGLLITLLGSTVTLALDALSYLLSAIGIARIQIPEPPPPRAAHARRRDELVAGWLYIFAHQDLRALFLNAMLFGGSIMAAAPLTMVLMLTQLHFTPWQYGLVLGLPCLGGVLGSTLTTRLTVRFGASGVLLGSGLLRTPWALLTPLAPAGTGGLVLLVVADFGLLLCAGVFNPSFATYRMLVVEDHFQARVTTAWSITSRTVQPVCIGAGAVLASVAGLRPTLALAGVVCVASAPLLPWRSAQYPATTAVDAAPGARTQSALNSPANAYNTDEEQISDPSNATYRRIFDELFTQGRRAVLTQRHLQDVLPVEGGPWGLSVVFTTDALAGQDLEEIARQAQAIAGAGHWLTGARGCAHVTVRSIERHRSHIPQDDPLLTRCTAALHRTVAELQGPVVLRLSGLTLTPAGVLACAYPRNANAGAFSARLRAELGQDGAFEDSYQRNIWHISIVHFAGPLTHPHALIEWVRTRRDLAIGDVVVDAAHVATFGHNGHRPIITALSSAPMPH